MNKLFLINLNKEKQGLTKFKSINTLKILFTREKLILHLKYSFPMPQHSLKTLFVFRLSYEIRVRRPLERRRKIIAILQLF